MLNETWGTFVEFADSPEFQYSKEQSIVNKLYNKFSKKYKKKMEEEKTHCFVIDPREEVDVHCKDLSHLYMEIYSLIYHFETGNYLHETQEEIPQQWLNFAKKSLICTRFSTESVRKSVRVTLGEYKEELAALRRLNGRKR